MRIAEGLTFDVMLEAKVKDLALIRLRPDLLRYGPDVAQRFGLEPAEAPAFEAEEQEFLEEEEDGGEAAREES
jgi:UV DNA damage endonuclease